MESFLDKIGFFLNFLSAFILFFGVIFFIRIKFNWGYFYILILFFFEIGSRILGHFFKSNILIFNISFFIQFAFLTHFYFSKVYLINKNLKNSVISLGFLLLLLAYLNAIPSYLQPYIRVIYSFTIMLYSLGYIYLLLKERITYKKYTTLLNSSILLFFCIDAFLAIATDYLINNSLLLVSWFWMFRAIFLQLFYGTLIYYVWKTGKTQQPY